MPASIQERDHRVKLVTHLMSVLELKGLECRVQ